MLRLWLLLLLVAYPAAWARDCKMDNQCRCTFDDDSDTMILSSIGRQDDTALVQDPFAPDNYANSYNLCFPFSEGTCNNPAESTIITKKACVTSPSTESSTGSFNAPSVASSIESSTSWFQPMAFFLVMAVYFIAGAVCVIIVLVRRSFMSMPNF